MRCRCSAAVDDVAIVAAGVRLAAVSLHHAARRGQPHLCVAAGSFDPFTLLPLPLPLLLLPLATDTATAAAALPGPTRTESRRVGGGPIGGRGGVIVVDARTDGGRDGGRIGASLFASDMEISEGASATGAGWRTAVPSAEVKKGFDRRHEYTRRSVLQKTHGQGWFRAQRTRRWRASSGGISYITVRSYSMKIETYVEVVKASEGPEATMRPLCFRTERPTFSSRWARSCF